MPITMPAQPAAAMAALRAAGIPAWVVGGAVRDSLLGRPVKDWDLTVGCTPAALAAALPDAKPMGGVYGTVVWHGVEITPCRAESGYSDHRHPDQVSFGADLRQDLARRDFTVNAMAWDGQVVIDPYHGRYDLADGVLRCVGDPAVRFAEDALRILRLYRFAGTLGFAPEPATAAAALAQAESLAAVSGQRVRGELEKALAGPRPGALAPLIAAGGLAAFGLPGAALAGRPDELAALDEVPAVPLCRWWALLRLTQASLPRAAKAFGFGRGFCRDIQALDGFYTAGCPADRHALKRRLLTALPAPVEDVAYTMAAVDPAFAGLPGQYAYLCASGEPWRKDQLAITPAELLTLGVPPKRIGAVQACLLRAVVDTPALNVWPTLAQMARGLADLG